MKLVQTAATPATRETELNSLSMLTAIVVLAVVTMTFGAMIAVFFIRAAAPLYWGHLQIPRILWVSTAALLASSATFEASRRALIRNDQTRGFHMLAWSCGLGLAFLGGQIMAWIQVLRSGIVLNRNPHSWFIFLFTGLHGAHILLGLGGLAYLAVRTHEPASGPKYQMKTRAVANGVGLFWHYLDFLWILLFGLLLVWKR